MEQDGHYREIAEAQLFGDDGTPESEAQATARARGTESASEVNGPVATSTKEAQ
jgi:hypothetical protein